MGDRTAPQIYSIAAHRGFADALVAGLVPRYSEEGLGLARLTLLLPSARAARTISEAFIRHFGANGQAGMLMPRMVMVGDLDLDETLGALLDPLGAGADIPPAADPTRRWLRLAELIRLEQGDTAPRGAALMRMSREIARAMDRLLAEKIAPDDLLGEEVIGLLTGDLSDHWRDSLALFAKVQARWLAELDERGEVDTATRRNMLFARAARKWRSDPPATPIVAAGVTSAAPELANLLRVVSELPQGAVILPDFDLSMDDPGWEELGLAGDPSADTPFARSDAVTHPQYHLKLLLNRMNVARGEVQPWHRAGIGKAPPERSHAISSLFLPPEASKLWVDLPPEKRRLSGVRLIESANPEEEAQACALVIRKALAEPQKRVALISPDRGLARRVTAHLRRWNIETDDTAGRPLSQTPAGRLFLLLAELIEVNAAPVPLMALLGHPLVARSDQRAKWLERQRALEMRLRGPRPAPGLIPLAPEVAKIARTDPGAREWWDGVQAILAPLLAYAERGEVLLAELLDALAEAGEKLCGEHLWAKEDGRALASFVEELRGVAQQTETVIDPADGHAILRDAMDETAVRPPYGGHPRVAISGLLESRMTRADVTICAGLNEGVWPAASSSDPLLAPAILRLLGVPGADFRIGLAAHDLAGAMGAPEVVLSRARRDVSGPAIPSRFWLRVEALLGDGADRDKDLRGGHREKEITAIAAALDLSKEQPAPYTQPQPSPNAQQRKVDISVTALDNLRGDPYQFYAAKILNLRSLDPLDAEPSPAWQGTLAHDILERWHKEGGALRPIAEEILQDMNAHPLMRGLWRPRLFAALEWIEQQVGSYTAREVISVEAQAELQIDGVRVHGRADRIDRFEDGSLAIIDYKTGSPPTGKEVAKGYRLQLGLLGMMAEAGGVEGIAAGSMASAFEYWSLGKDRNRADENRFGYIKSPVKAGKNKSKIEPDEFLPKTEEYLRDAIGKWILGDHPFTARLAPDFPGYSDFDQLMRLDEWYGRESEEKSS